MQKKFILFDFDGVIVDSFKPAFDVQKMRCPHLTEENYRKRFEGNINDWQDPADVHTPECRLDLDFFKEYIPRMKTEVRVVPQMESVISELEKQYTLIVISSTISAPIKELLEFEGLAPHFAEIMGNDVHKSKIEKMKMVFAKYGAAPSDCVFITDTLGDMREAEKMNVAAIGVAWGFHSIDTLEKGKPFRIVKTSKELLGAVGDYFSNTQN